MAISDIITKTGNIILYGTGIFLGTAAINNLHNGITTGNKGYYQNAAVLGILSTYLVASNFYQDRWNKRELQKIKKLDENIRKSGQILETLL